MAAARTFHNLPDGGLGLARLTGGDVGLCLVYVAGGAEGIEIERSLVQGHRRGKAFQCVGEIAGKSQVSGIPRLLCQGLGHVLSRCRQVVLYLEGQYGKDPVGASAAGGHGEHLLGQRANPLRHVGTGQFAPIDLQQVAPGQKVPHRDKTRTPARDALQ